MSDTSPAFELAALRAPAELRKLPPDTTVLALHKSGHWSVLKTDNWGRLDGQVELWGQIDGNVAYESGQEYAELFSFLDSHLVGWVFLPEATK